MKKLAALLVLLATLGCAGSVKYGRTEGPFRAKFARIFTWSMVNTPWSLPIFLDGVLPDDPIHIEGYLINNGTEYYQFHKDVPGIRTRTFEVMNKFTVNQYCEAVGRPMDRFDADTEFWNRGQFEDDPSRSRVPTDPIEGISDKADGKVEIVFRFYALEEIGHGQWEHGKLLTEAKTKVQLQCYNCECGGRFR
jgi:hypothetical protein